MSNPSKYPWIRNSVEVDTSVVNCLAITAPTGLYLNQNQTTPVNLSQPYYVYLNNWPFYIVNQAYGGTGSPPINNSKIFFDASLSIIELLTEDNNNYNGHGAETSIKINGAYLSNQITLKAQWSTTQPTDGVLGEFDGNARQIRLTGYAQDTTKTKILLDSDNKQIALTAVNGVTLNGSPLGGGIAQITSSNGSINITNPTGPLVDITTSGGGGGGVSDIQAGTGIFINSTGMGGTGSVTITNTGVLWSELNSSITTYNQLGPSNYEFGLTDNFVYSTNETILLCNNSNLNGTFGTSSTAYLKVGDIFNGFYTVVANVKDNSDPTNPRFCTMATIGTDMYLYANKNSNTNYGAGVIYLGGQSILPANGLYPNSQRPNIGSGSLPWGTVYATNYDTISDLKLKENISKLDTQYSIDLIKNVNPVSYNLKNDEKNKIHFGVIAQEIKEIIGNENLALHTDGENQTISYTQFISPLIKSVQYLLKKVEDLEAEIKELKK